MWWGLRSSCSQHRGQTSDPPGGALPPAVRGPLPALATGPPPHGHMGGSSQTGFPLGSVWERAGFIGRPQGEREKDPTCLWPYAGLSLGGVGGVGLCVTQGPQTPVFINPANFTSISGAAASGSPLGPPVASCAARALRTFPLSQFSTEHFCVVTWWTPASPARLCVPLLPSVPSAAHSRDSSKTCLVRKR